MRKLAILLVAAVSVAASAAWAGNRGPHPVFAWNGNEYLFEVNGGQALTRLTGYRNVGGKWQMVGTTTIQKGQRTAEKGFLQRIWFKGKRIGSVEADLSNPYWRRYPSEDRNGGNGIFN
ncbi:MAG: hypothetical protein AB7S41_11820 [Parvibaculaceae bacterium]